MKLDPVHAVATYYNACVKYKEYVILGKYTQTCVHTKD